MSAWAGFWIGVGLVLLGIAIDNGLTNIARTLFDRVHIDFTSRK